MHLESIFAKKNRKIPCLFRALWSIINNLIRKFNTCRHKWPLRNGWMAKFSKLTCSLIRLRNHSKKSYIAYLTKISIENFLQFSKLDFFNLTYTYNYRYLLNKKLVLILPNNFRMEFSVLVHFGFPIMWLKSLDSCDTSGFVDLP